MPKKKRQLAERFKKVRSSSGQKLFKQLKALGIKNYMLLFKNFVQLSFPF